MVREFTLPDVGEGVHEGELVSWLVEEGDAVSEDQPVAEVETDKALVEVPSPVNGTVRELHWTEGDVVPVGELFVTYEVEGEARSASDTASGEPASEGEARSASETRTGSDVTREGETNEELASEGKESAAAADTAGDPGAIGADSEETATPDGRVFAPPSVRRLAREEGVDLAQVGGSGPSGRVTEGDVREAAAAGDEPGGAAETGAGSERAAEAESEAEMATGEPPGGADTASAAEPAGERTTSSTAGVESADRERTLAAPATRRLADEEGVDIDAVPATEERDGEAFVTPEAVREYAAAKRRGAEASQEAAASVETGAAGTTSAGDETGSTKGVSFAEGERERREPFRGVRRTIAEAMERSAYTAPHVTHHDEVDVTRLVEVREELKPEAAERGISLTFLPFVTKAVIAALKEYPEMNAMIDDEADEIVYRDYYNVGIATSTDAGLMVPVVEDADRKGLLQLASEMDELVTKARERTISPEELRGSTFTITNVGGIGGEYATPILNYPEAGILAMGEITRKPRVVADENGEESIEPRSVLPLSLSFDHRLIDGAVGARFTNAVMERLERPELLLLE